MFSVLANFTVGTVETATSQLLHPELKEFFSGLGLCQETLIGWILCAGGRVHMLKTLPHFNRTAQVLGQINWESASRQTQRRKGNVVLTVEARCGDKFTAQVV